MELRDEAGEGRGQIEPEIDLLLPCVGYFNGSCLRFKISKFGDTSSILKCKFHGFLRTEPASLMFPLFFFKPWMLFHCSLRPLFLASEWRLLDGTDNIMLNSHARERKSHLLLNYSNNGGQYPLIWPFIHRTCNKHQKNAMCIMSVNSLIKKNLPHFGICPIYLFSSFFLLFLKNASRCIFPNLFSLD